MLDLEASSGEPSQTSNHYCRDCQHSAEQAETGTVLKPFAISVLDTGVPEQTVELARRVEATGYGRIWVTEHHTETQSACPSIMAAAVLASTTRLSVTVGGVLARIHCPYFIAEQLKLLAKLYGNRVQFGVVGSPPSDWVRERINTHIANTPEEYTQRLLQLRDLALSISVASPAEQFEPARSEKVHDKHDTDSHPIGPIGAEPTSFTVCGTSEKSATITAELGFPFAFHHFLGPHERNEDRIAVCRKYRESGGSRLSVAVSGISADTSSEAERQWEEFNQGRHVLRPSFLGSHEESAAEIATIADELTADEIVIQPLTRNDETRIIAFEGVFQPLKDHFDH